MALNEKQLNKVCPVNVEVENEVDIAQVIVVSEPSTEIWSASLHLETSFYLFDPQAAISEHKNMQKILRSFGATVYNLKEVLLMKTDDKENEAFKDLLLLASKSFRYDLSTAKRDIDELKKLKLTKSQRSWLQKELKRLELQLTPEYQENIRLKTLNSMTAEQLIEVIFNRPTVELRIRSWFTESAGLACLDVETKLNPLGPWHYARDQQITTRKGIVMLRTTAGREGEGDVNEIALKKLGMKIIGKQTTGYAEGGDFMPFGDIAFFGEGYRTTIDGIRELMAKGWLDYQEIAVVRTKSDFHIDRMHLDTFFTLLDEKRNVLLYEDILTNPEYRRFVDLYSKSERHSQQKGEKFGEYVKVEENIEFGEFLKNRKFNITFVNTEEQLQLATNILNLGNGTILIPYGEQQYVERLEKLGINLVHVNVDNLKQGKGALHCMTQVVRRQPQWMKS